MENLHPNISGLKRNQSQASYDTNCDWYVLALISNFSNSYVFMGFDAVDILNSRALFPLNVV